MYTRPVVEQPVVSSLYEPSTWTHKLYFGNIRHIQGQSNSHCHSFIVNNVLQQKTITDKITGINSLIVFLLAPGP